MTTTPTTYTPGPWHEPSPWPALNDGLPRYEIQGLQRSIAIVRSGLVDANLISAAPDLLEALIMLLDRTSNPVTDHAFYTLADARKAAAAAINKAEGR